MGREHTNVATQLNNMALLHKKLNKHDRAVQLYRFLRRLFLPTLAMMAVVQR